MFFGVPDLTTWKTQKDRDEDVNDVKDSVYRNEELGKPVACVSLH